MKHVEKNITSNITLEKVISSKSKGIMSVTGDFSNGLVEFFISLNPDNDPNPWLNRSGTAFKLTEPMTFPFDLDLHTPDSNFLATIYVTLSGATSPNITIDTLDTRGNAL